MLPPRSTPDRPAWAAAVALNRAADGKAPDWIQLLPAGERAEGRDGRGWTNDHPAVVAAFLNHSDPIAIDFEHAQDLLAPSGSEAPASGWIEGMEIRDGAVWGRVDWTPKGRNAVENREYRFFSPAITFDPATQKIHAVIGGALVNRSNFRMAALNRETPELHPMKQIAAALGLAETATEGECVMGLAALKAEKDVALNRAAVPDLAKFVPRADLDAALNRATSAETTLRDRDAGDHGKAVAAAIDGAIAAGKVAPASRDYYVATCRDAAGLAAFTTHVAGLPTLFGASVLAGKDPAAGTTTATALNAEQRSAAKAMGLDEMMFAAFLAEQAKKAEPV